MAPMNPPTSTHHGFKHITAANWQEPDLPCSFFCYTSDYWVEAHLKPRLGPNVPSDVVALFEVARGAMIYGWFFYPIITLGAEQCLRVLEAGVKFGEFVPVFSTLYRHKMPGLRFVKGIFGGDDSFPLVAAADIGVFDQVVVDGKGFLGGMLPLGNGPAEFSGQFGKV